MSPGWAPASGICEALMPGRKQALVWGLRGNRMIPWYLFLKPGSPMGVPWEL